MAEVLVKLKALSNTLTESEKRIAEFFQVHVDDVPYMSVYEVAEKNEVSVPTVIRMTRKLGYDRFKDFKVDLAKDHAHPASEASDVFDIIRPEDTDEDIITKVFSGNIKSLEDTRTILDKEVLINLAGVMLKASRIIFLGIGGSGYVAADAALRISHLDIQAEAYTEPVQMLLQSSRLDETCVAVGISHSGCTELTVKALRVARENGAVTASISNYLNSPLSSESNYSLCTSFMENKVRAAALSSNIAQYCIVDSLYLLLAKNKRSFGALRDIEETIEQTIRIK